MNKQEKKNTHTKRYISQLTNVERNRDRGMHEQKNPYCVDEQRMVFLFDCTGKKWVWTLSTKAPTDSELEPTKHLHRNIINSKTVMMMMMMRRKSRKIVHFMNVAFGVNNYVSYVCHLVLRSRWKPKCLLVACSQTIKFASFAIVIHFAVQRMMPPSSLLFCYCVCVCARLFAPERSIHHHHLSPRQCISFSLKLKIFLSHAIN